MLECPLKYGFQIKFFNNMILTTWHQESTVFPENHNCKFDTDFVQMSSQYAF